MGLKKETLEEFKKELESVLQEYCILLTEGKNAEDPDECYEALSSVEEKFEEELNRVFKKYFTDDYFLINEEVERKEIGHGTSSQHIVRSRMLGCAKISDKEIHVYEAKILETHSSEGINCKLKEIQCHELPVITEEKTPFTCALIDEIPWAIVVHWMPAIFQLIYDLAEYELDGKLEEGIEKIKGTLEKVSWNYEFGHVLRALNRVLKRRFLKGDEEWFKPLHV